MKMKLVVIPLVATVFALGACSANPVKEPEVKAESKEAKEVELETTTATDLTNTEEQKSVYKIPEELRGSYKDDKNKIYTFDNGTELTTVSYVSQWDQDPEVEVWNNGNNDFLHHEDEEGVYTGWIDSNYYVDIMYPVLIGQEWERSYENEGTYKITNVDQTIETKAGIFSGVITVEDTEGYNYYYAEGVGYIKTEQNEGVINELIALEDR
ncbi:hypothetical protein MKX54_12670 [Alkalihalobacillus sp. FSL R5-0424]